jgi:hypothetical protein
MIHHHHHHHDMPRSSQAVSAPVQVFGLTLFPRLLGIFLEPSSYIPMTTSSDLSIIFRGSGLEFEYPDSRVRPERRCSSTPASFGRPGTPPFWQRGIEYSARVEAYLRSRWSAREAATSRAATAGDGAVRSSDGGEGPRGEARPETGRSSKTVMLQGLPLFCKRGKLSQILDQMGFAGRYDIISIPSSKRTKGANLGYAFVSLIDERDEQAFRNAFNRFRFPGSNRTCCVRDAHIQESAPGSSRASLSNNPAL